jgi:hypothetical protein
MIVTRLRRRVNDLQASEAKKTGKSQYNSKAAGGLGFKENHGKSQPFWPPRGVFRTHRLWSRGGPTPLQKW